MWNSLMKVRHRKFSIIAGLLILTAGLFNILWIGAAFSRIFDLKEIIRPILVVSPFPYVILGIGFGGNTVLASVLAIVFILGIILSLIYGVIVLVKRSPVFAWVGLVGALICVPILGIASIILILLAKRSFIRQ
jgi:hypothetical protein